MKKFNFFLDSIFTTMLLFFGIGLISQIPMGDMINPVKKMFGDFELTDIVFSRMRESKNYDDRVTLVNIGNMSRAQIAEQIEIINQFHPKVIGIDAFFMNPKDHVGDSALCSAFSKVDNLVLVSELIRNTSTGGVDHIKTSHPMFMKYAHSGFADLNTEGRDIFKTSRVCIPKDKIGNLIYYSFPTMLATLYDRTKAKKYLDRNLDIEIINFQRNIDIKKDITADFNNLGIAALDHQEVFKADFDGESIIKDKIVVMGFMGDDFNDPAWIDKFFTPANNNYVGKTYPDMFGVVVHANILSMILNGDFINVMPDKLNIILSILFVFLNVWFITYCYHKFKDWYDGAANLFIFCESLMLILLLIFVFKNFNYKFDLVLLVVCLFLIVHFIEFYQGIIKVAIKKLAIKNYKGENQSLKGTPQVIIPSGNFD